MLTALARLFVLLQLARFLWTKGSKASLKLICPKIPSKIQPSHGLVSVIVPARNEAARLGACIEGLIRQQYPNVEIIVVDDCSSDSTPIIVRKVQRTCSRLILVSGEELPCGWTGKCWALHQGVERSAGRWFLFVDADTQLQPGALTAMLDRAHTARIAALSLLTRQQCETPLEWIIQGGIVALLSEALPPGVANHPAIPTLGARNGQCTLVSRTAYEKIGGHSRLRGDVVEDFSFAIEAKKAGIRLELADGSMIASTRMYASFADLWSGWTRTLHMGGQVHPILTALGVAFLSTAAVLPFVGIVAAIRDRSPSLLFSSLLQVALACGSRQVAAASATAPRICGLAYPIADLVFAALVLVAETKARTSIGLTWKGRRYVRVSGRWQHNPDVALTRQTARA